MNDTSSDDILLWKQRLAEQEALIHALQEKLSNREREIDHLQALLDKLRRMNFGSRSEKVSRRIEQMEADLNLLQKESDTLTGRVDACCRLLSPLEEALQDYVLTDGKPHADDTPVPVLLLGNKKRRPGVYGHTLMTTAIRGQRWHLQCGSPSARTEKVSTRRPILSAPAVCWAHARRKIQDVHVRTSSDLTEEALKRIGELYAVEADIRGMPTEQRLTERQRKVKPRLKSRESWLREKMKTLSRHSELTKAFAYALNQWSALTCYADYGWAEVDNNIAENALRTVSPGRTKFLFFGSDHGGERGALLYSMIGTCKLNCVDPEGYLRYVLDFIADSPVNRFTELLPWHITLPTE